MSKKIIRLGDPTSHGGQVIVASSGQKIGGVEVVLKGDKVSCPISGHGINPIIEGSNTWLVKGKPVALEGHRTACGCTLMSTLGDSEGGAF
jgi:uncharacterized Zn-binding protein involved in type VI secretion